MRNKTFFKFLLIGLCSIAFLQISNAQNHPKSDANTAASAHITKHLGLIAELTYVKSTAENFLIKQMKDSTLTASYKSQLIDHYLRLKATYDQIVLQLMADQIRKNHVKYFKQIDKARNRQSSRKSNIGSCKARVKEYLITLDTAYEEFQGFIEFKPQSGDIKKSGISPENLLGVLTFVSTTIKDIREARTKKVDAINLLLEGLRLSPIQDLGNTKTEPGGKEEKKK